MRCTEFPVCDGEWECDSGKWGLLMARPPRNCLGEAGSLPSVRRCWQLLTANELSSSPAAPDHAGMAWLQKGVYSAEGERKKVSPHPSGCWQALLVWQPEKTGEWRGLQMLRLISILLRLRSRRRGWLPAEG